MSLKCGIVGLPNVGKSTLFNTLTKSINAQAANFPFCTIEPNIGIITVPDVRLKKLEELVSPERVMPTTVELVDIAGLVKGASKGEGLGNKFLGNIRSVDAIVHVIRCFDDENVVHVDGSIDPIRDKEVIDTELQLKDLESLEKLKAKALKVAKTGDKLGKKQVEVTTKYIEHLLTGKSARSLEIDEDSLLIIKDLNLLTIKPTLYACNVDEASAVSGNAYVELVKAIALEEGAEILIGATQGIPVITKKMIMNLADKAIIIDVGKGTLYPEAISLAEKKNIDIYRLDITAALEGLIAALWATDDIVNAKMGRRKLHNESLVSGGFLGRGNEMIVDNVWSPKSVYGIADGKGDFVRNPSPEQLSRLENLRNLIE